jgi:hypothetical protein
MIGIADLRGKAFAESVLLLRNRRRTKWRGSPLIPFRWRGSARRSDQEDRWGTQ